MPTLKTQGSRALLDVVLQRCSEVKAVKIKTKENLDVKAKTKKYSRNQRYNLKLMPVRRKHNLSIL